MRSNLVLISAAGAFLAVVGCASVPPMGTHRTQPGEPRIDSLPMYGQPEILRPDWWKKADEDFIRDAVAGIGSREKASHIWWAQNPKNYQPYWGFGPVMVERDRFDDAIKYFEKANQLVDDNHQAPALLADMATAYSLRAASLPVSDLVGRQRYFSLANEHFAKGVRLDDSYANGRRQWAKSLYREGNYTAAWQKVHEARAHKAPPLEDALLRALREKMPEPP